MSSSSDPHALDTIEALESLYGTPVGRSLTKEIDYISDHYRAFVEAAPFVVISSVGPEGTDATPRGDPPGFVRVADQKTVLIPDRRGNNRIDTLRNIVRDPRVSLLFLVPGVGETLRINGRASITADPALCEEFSIQGKPARCVIRVAAERVYFQCSKALIRSRLWDVDAQVKPGALPTAGSILKALSTEPFDADEYDRNYPKHMRKTIY
ncbi:MAG: pyridoxamine 5'-phosphate oxidase family protein [Pseudomonadota bacterium]